MTPERPPCRPFSNNHPKEVIRLASKEDVRAWAKQAANGQNLAPHQMDAIKRTTSQAGSEGAAVTRILGDGKA